MEGNDKIQYAIENVTEEAYEYHQGTFGSGNVPEALGMTSESDGERFNERYDEVKEGLNANSTRAEVLAVLGIEVITFSRLFISVHLRSLAQSGLESRLNPGFQKQELNPAQLRVVSCDI